MSATRDFLAFTNLMIAADAAARQAFLDSVTKNYGAGFARHVRGYIDLSEGAQLVDANEKQINADRRRHRKAPKQSME